MVCDIICKCKSQNDYYDSTTEQCLLKKSISKECKTDLNCRDDKNLECKNRICSCNLMTPQWSITLDKCINPSDYNEVCDSLIECDSIKSLKCYSGKCECLKEYNNEYFWDTSMCVPAIEYNQPCLDSSSSFMCKTLTEDTACLLVAKKLICTCKPLQFYSKSSKKCETKKLEGIECQTNDECRDDVGLVCELKCKCRPQQYFSLLSQKCETQVLQGESCVEMDACRNDLGLSCQNNVCDCNRALKYWSAGICVDLLTYNSEPCSDDKQCAGDLICRSQEQSCTCPDNVAEEKCDCPTLKNGYEYYWNGNNCVLAEDYENSCTASYMCKTLTEGTKCIESESFKCKCDKTQFYDLNIKKCADKKTIGSECQSAEECLSDLGLGCFNRICSCDERIKHWDGEICINSFTYNAGPCSSNIQCAGNLICQLSGTSCRCNITVPINFCDCPSNSVGNENYWDGSDCASTKRYNESCTVDYMCSVLAENTRCINSMCICRTGALFFNFLTRRCESKRLNGIQCQQEDECRSDLGLKCDGGFCKCSSETEIWNGFSCQ
jgi:hypothetical protein